VTASFVPNAYPRFSVRGRALTDAQQHQYDVLRTVGGKLVLDKQGWWRELSPTHRERIYGLNQVAMFKLVSLSLVECISAPTNGLMFVLAAMAKDIPGLRYKREGSMLKEVQS
jgi:hypothetical protein